MGRHTKLTSEVQQQICDASALGVDRVAAANFAGVSYEAMRTWMRRGEEGEEPFAGFLVSLQKAEADAIVRAVGHIQSAIEEKRFACKGTHVIEGRCAACGEPYHVEKRCRSSIVVPGSWTASAWMLERRYPQRYGRSDRVEVTSALSPDDLVSLLRELAEVVVVEVSDEGQRERIAEGWVEVARRRGVSPSSEAEDRAERMTRARRAQARLPGSAP